MVPKILVIFKLWTRQSQGRKVKARTRQKCRSKAKADILRGKDEAAPNAASRQGICLEDYITAGNVTSVTNSKLEMVENEAV